MDDEQYVELRKSLRKAYKSDLIASTVIIAKKILEIDSEDVVALYRLGEALTDLAQYEQAESILKRAFDSCPDENKHHICGRLGLLYKEIKDYEQAERWFKNQIALNPFDTSGYVYLGSLYAIQGNYKKAKVLHRSALECEEGYFCEAHHNLGLIYRAEENYDKAYKHFLKAIELDPDYKAAVEALEDVERAIQLKEYLEELF